MNTLLPKTVIKMFAPLALCVSAIPMTAAANQCATISCDCSAIESSVDAALCEKQEAQLIKDCNLAEGLTGYCQIAGFNGNPMPFNLVQPEAVLADEDAIEQALEQVDAFYWSVNEDLKTSLNYENNGSYGNALAVYKNLASSLDRVYGVKRQAYQSWRALDDKDEAEEVAADAYEALAERGEALYLRARSLWAARAESDAKLQRKRQILAMNVLRYAGSAYQQAAELAAIGKEREAAAKLWETAAQTGELMLLWRQQAKSKAQYINYYRQQTVASWYRAALYWERIEEPEQAQLAREKAKLWSTEQVAQR
ncbi:hypothetical protein L1F30_09715 [Simiduia sp. 21SJ11W-1]|uniref:hypothetical protein n=1 Tax=Simiduia sp. 21SJ11W-1 TaxID=2909669 RepID=UPI00209D1DDE|nr:hypothetical protein [Simiduia sp. 21SJ11W-1]UTA46450.1 hypothetical protein L1F30_09715 [Simiduia sp. 21SJ11W-1]